MKQVQNEWWHKNSINTSTIWSKELKNMDRNTWIRRLLTWGERLDVSF